MNIESTFYTRVGNDGYASQNIQSRIEAPNKLIPEKPHRQDDRDDNIQDVFYASVQGRLKNVMGSSCDDPIK